MTRSLLVIPTGGTLGGLTLVQDVNAALSGLVTFNAGAGWPSAGDLGLSGLAGVYAHNATTYQLAKRDQADTAWIPIGTFDETAKTFTPAGLGTAGALAVDTDGTLAANSDVKIPSQKAVKTYTLPASYLDTDATLTANSNVKVASQAAVKTYVAAQLAVITATDLTARDQIALTNLRLMLTTGVSTGALVAGKMWELLSDEWATGSSGYTLVSASPSYYGNPGGYTLATPTGAAFGSMTSGGGLAAAFDGNANTAFASAAYDGAYIDTSPSYIGKAFTAGANIGQVVATSSNNNGFSGGYPGQPITLTIYTKAAAPSAYNDGSVLATTTFNDVNALTTKTLTFTPTNNAYTWMSCSSTAHIQSDCAELQYYTASPPTNMTMVSPAVSVSAAPTYMDAYFLWKDDDGSSVLGTDLTVDLTRDGTTWTAATLTNLTPSAGFDGTYAVIRARANVGGQPAGTSLKSRIKTLNTKAQRVAAPALYAE